MERGRERVAPRGARSARPRVPRLFLFDLDGTLFDDRYSRRKGLAAARRTEPCLRRRSVDWLVDQYGRLLNTAHQRDVLAKVDPRTSRRERFRRVARMLGEELSDARVDAAERAYRSTYVHHGRAIPGSAGLLDTLRSRGRVGVVTNNRVAQQGTRLRAIGLAGRVDFLVISEGVGFWKPDPRIFEIALDRGGAAAEEAVMIRDSWENDVLGALGAGLRAVWFDQYARGPPAGTRAVPIVRSYRPRAPVLRALGVPHHATTGSADVGARPAR